MDSIHEDVTRHLNDVTLQSQSNHPLRLSRPAEKRASDIFCEARNGARHAIA